MKNYVDAADYNVATPQRQPSPVWVGHEKSAANPLGRSPLEQRLARQEEIVQELTAAVDAMQTRLQTLSRGRLVSSGEIGDGAKHAEKPQQAPVIEQIDGINDRLRRQISGITSFMNTLDI